jgi:hypothetical protein
VPDKETFELTVKLQTPSFPFLLRGYAPYRFMIEIFCSSVGLEGEKVYVLNSCRMTGIIRNMTSTATGLNSD